MNIDVVKLENIKDQLDSLQGDDALLIEDNGVAKYAIVNIETYDKVSDLLSALDATNPINTEVKIIGDKGPGEELTYEEYERVKSLIMSAVDKAFKPKAEKLN